ncbi:MAG: hypothetical protein KME67_05115 [Candidatus Thiodiazotropha sp. (ex Codakia orbicularis)]|nr:hypothetical protein [Candidatus Thiodiazotropha sp. (ex Codakia orbicularis)]
MDKTREKLEPAAAEASRRLEEIWLNWKAQKKAQGKKASKEQVSLDLGWSTSMFGQYARGDRSLGLQALIRISRYFSVPAEDIYPELIERVNRWWTGALEDIIPYSTQSDGLNTADSKALHELSSLFLRSDERGRAAILALAKHEVSSSEESDKLEQLSAGRLKTLKARSAPKKRKKR